MNRSYIGKLMELAEKDHEIMHLLADSGTGFDEMFRKNFPEQIYNFGIAEENMVAAAAGMASVGKKPFVFTAGAFLAYRSMEFIRNDICFQNLNVKIVGMGSGLSWSSLGPTHHTTEDFSVLRAIPNLAIYSPSTPQQVAACVQFAYEHAGPAYIRIGMNNEKEFFDSFYSLSESGIDILKEGNDIAVLVSGSILSETYEACSKLEEEGIHSKLINISKIKPFHGQLISELSKAFNKLFVVEEHNIHGGLSSIVSETVAYNGLNLKVVPIGIEDMFAVGYGSELVVRRNNKLDSENIYQKIKGTI